MPAKVNRELCIHCGGCVGVCPVDAMDLKESILEINTKLCIDCGTCVRFCPVKALSLGGAKKAGL